VTAHIVHCIVRGEDAACQRRIPTHESVESLMHHRFNEPAEAGDVDQSCDCRLRGDRRGTIGNVGGFVAHPFQVVIDF
jgi:hypothetical protein